MKDKKVIQYLVYTFGMTWLLWGTAILGMKLWGWEFGNPILMTCYTLGVFGPVIGGILAKKQVYSKDAFKAFLKNIVNVKQPIKYYAFAIIAPICLLVLPMFTGGSEMKQPIYMGFVLIIPMIVGGGLEEIGWRGFLQPELEKHYSPVVSTTIIGAVWSLWHMPLWFMPFTNQATWNYGFYCVLVFGFAFLLASVHRVTQSIFLCILCHATINAFMEVFMTNTKTLPIIPGLIAAIGLLVFIQRKKIEK